MLKSIIIFLFLITAFALVENKIVIDKDSLLEISKNIEKTLYSSHLHLVESIVIGDFNITISDLTILITYKKKEALNAKINEIHYEGFELIMMYNITIDYDTKEDNPITIRKSFGSVKSSIDHFYLRRLNDNTFYYKIINDNNEHLDYTLMDWLQFELFQPVLLRKEEINIMILNARNNYLKSALRNYPPSYAEFYLGRFILMLKGDYYTLDPSMYHPPNIIKVINVEYSYTNKVNIFNSDFELVKIEIEYLLQEIYSKVMIYVKKITFGQDGLYFSTFNALIPPIPHLLDNIVALLKNEAKIFNQEQKYTIAIW